MSRMINHNYGGYVIGQIPHVCSIVYYNGKWVWKFRGLAKAKAWIDTHPPGWLPAYEEVRSIWEGKECVTLLREPEIVEKVWFCGHYFPGPLLRGRIVHPDGSEVENAFRSLIEVSRIIERIPLRLDPYTKQLVKLIKANIE